jgi:hypothetical protein
MNQTDKIFVVPSGPIFFEGETRRIPEEGAFVSPSSYYFRLVRDGSLQIAGTEKQHSKAETQKE